MAYKTLVYSPDVRIVIGSGNKEYDVSRDLVRGGVDRKTNSVSSLTFDLANKGLKYNGAFKRMDRVVVWMRRIAWVQVFSGYLDSVPVKQLYPGTVTFRASCTLKRLLHTWWDPGLANSMALFDQNKANQTGETDPETGLDYGQRDSGLGNLLQNLLVEVGGWDPKQIRVQDFPTGFAEYMAENLEKLDNSVNVKKFEDLMGLNSSAGGVVDGGGSAVVGPVAPPANGSTYNMDEIVNIAAQAGVPQDQLANCTAIAWAESKGDYKIQSPPNSNGTVDQGLWQINSPLHDGKLPGQDRFNPSVNAQLMMIISSNGTNWQPWSTWSYHGTAQQFIPQAQAAVARRAANGASSGGVTSGGGSGNTGRPSGGNPTTPGQVPISNTGATAPSATGKPNPDSEGAVQYALSEAANKTPYVWGGTTPKQGLDCSGLTMNAYKAIGIAIGRTTWDQAKTGRTITPAQIQRGDLIQPHDGHVVMWLGGNKIVHSPQPGDICKVADCYFDINSAYIIKNYAQNGGADPSSPYGDPATMGPGSTNNTGGGSVVASETIARNLYALIFDPGKFYDPTSQLFTKERAFINDEPLIQMVQTMTKSGLREFQSAPNGDFVAFYPDYFGLDGQKPVLKLEDIEMKNVQIDLNDDNLATHVYVAGSMGYIAASPSLTGWLASRGVVTVEQEWLFKRMVAASPVTPESYSAEEILGRYGVRPYKQEFSMIYKPEFEFLMACQLFMRKWAEQYSTRVEFTFLPELFPGMRVELVGHDLVVYVQQVSHNFDFENGFSTSAVITAPSNANPAGVANTTEDDQLKQYNTVKPTPGGK